MILAPPTICIDTREQAPWIASVHRDGRRILLPVVRRALMAGDYTIEGCAEEIAIERKSLADWVGTMFGASETADGERATSWERFKRELARARDGVVPADGRAPTPPLRRFCVIVEASRADVVAHRYRSMVHPNSVIGRSDSVWPDHGFPVLWASTEAVGEGADACFDAARREQNELGIRLLCRWWAEKQRAKGAADKDIAAAFRLAAKGAALAPARPQMAPPAVQYDAPRLGMAAGRGKR